jgi:hypothetical protein
MADPLWLRVKKDIVALAAKTVKGFYRDRPSIRHSPFQCGFVLAQI